MFPDGTVGHHRHFIGYRSLADLLAFNGRSVYVQDTALDLYPVTWLGIIRLMKVTDVLFGWRNTAISPRSG